MAALFAIGISVCTNSTRVASPQFSSASSPIPVILTLSKRVGFADVVLWVVFTIFGAFSGQIVALESPHATSSVSLPVSVAFSDDDEYSATLESISEGFLRLAREGQRVEVDFSTVRSLRFISNQAAAATAEVSADLYELQLSDGSRVFCERISSDGEQLRATMGDRSFSLQSQQVQAARLGVLTEEQRAAWNEIRDAEFKSDVLVVKQPTGALTKIEGIVLGISPEAVTFEFSRQQVPVPFARLAGIRFYSASTSSTGKPVAVLKEKLGNEWVVSELHTLDSYEIRATLQSGSEITVPLGEMSEIDFSIGSVKYLAELPPIRQSADSIFDFPVATLKEQDVFGFRPIPSRNTPGQSIGPSLEFLGGSEATFEVPPGFTKLVGSVELRPKGTRFTRCTVELYLENNRIWHQELSETRQPASFEVPVVGEQRLRLVVKPGSKVPTGDVVMWLEPRLVR